MGSSRFPSTSLQPCKGRLPALLPVGRERPSTARWAFGTCVLPGCNAQSMGNVGWWQEAKGKGAGGERCSPSPSPRPAKRAANSCRLGSCESIIPGMSSCTKRAGYSCDSRCWGHRWRIPRSYAQLPFPRIPGLTADRVSLFTTPLSAWGDGFRHW